MYIILLLSSLQGLAKSGVSFYLFLFSLRQYIYNVSCIYIYIYIYIYLYIYIYITINDNNNNNNNNNDNNNHNNMLSYVFMSTSCLPYDQRICSLSLNYSSLQTHEHVTSIISSIYSTISWFSEGLWSGWSPSYCFQKLWFQARSLPGKTLSSVSLYFYLLLLTFNLSLIRITAPILQTTAL